MLPAQQQQLERLVMPDAWAYYGTLPPLDLDGLLADAGGRVQAVAAQVQAVAAQVLTYAADMAEAQPGGASGAIDIKLGSLSLKRSAAASVTSTQAAQWRARAQALKLEGERTRRSGPRYPAVVSVPVRPG